MLGVRELTKDETHPGECFDDLHLVAIGSCADYCDLVNSCALIAHTLLTASIFRLHLLVS